MPVKKAAQAHPNLLLRRVRQERGWSQQEVADRIGVPQAYMVTRWENGTAFPGPGYREKLCALFGKNREELGLLKPLNETMLSTDTQVSISDPTIPLYTSHMRELVGREQVFTQIKEQLCSPDPGLTKFIAIDGLPGVGKTTLAAKLVTHSEVLATFSDGVLWAGLGPRANLHAHLSRWCTLVGITQAELATLRDSQSLAQVLRQVLWSKRVLIVLDDAWSIEDVLACMVGGPDCAYLLTTRIPKVATHFAGERSVHLSELSQEEGMHLLVQITPTIRKIGPEPLRSLVQSVGGLPLALTLMGNYLLLQARHQQRRRLQAALTLLQRAEERLRLTQPQAGIARDARLPIDTPLTLQAMIGLSVAVLSKEARQALSALALFPAKPARFSEEAALMVTAEGVEVLDSLVDIGLLESCGDDHYSLHQTIADYARHGLPQDAQAKQRLVAYMLTYVKEHHDDLVALEREWPLILAALDLALRGGSLDDFVQGVSAIALFLRVRGFATLRKPLLGQDHQFATDQHDHDHSLHIIFELATTLIERRAYEQTEEIAQLLLVPAAVPVIEGRKV